MFDKNSDYAHNKRTDAIVYISVTGAPVTLTCADFASEDEFLQWKRWSDGDYKDTEQSGRSFYDNCISLDESLDGGSALASVEDDFISKLDEPDRLHASAERSRQIKDALTEKQYRRLWMYYVNGLSERNIAEKEKAGQQRISKSILSGKKAIEKIFEKLTRDRG